MLGGVFGYPSENGCFYFWAGWLFCFLFSLFFWLLYLSWVEMVSFFLGFM